MKATHISDTLQQYILSTSLREHPVLTALREKTQTLPGSLMQITPDQGQFFALLLKLMSAENVLEIGTFTGYSALAMALALPNTGKVITCDIDKNATDIAKDYWQRAGVQHKIDLRLGPADETLIKLTEEKKVFDFAFIDADKRNYDRYYELCLNLLKPGGLLVIDNTFWGGKVIDIDNQTPQTQAIRQLNKKMHEDARVDISMVAVGDGVMLARKKLSSRGLTDVVA